MNERSDNNVISIKKSDDRFVKKAIIATDDSQGLLNVNQTPTRSTYELFFWLFSYTTMFTVRLTKDIFISILGYFYPGQLLPNHIVHLMNVHKNNFIQNESQAVTCSRVKLTNSYRLSLTKRYIAFKSYILSSRDDNETQCTSKDFAISNLESGSMFIIVNSNCISNSDSEEMIIDKHPNPKKCVPRKYVNKNISSINRPSTSKYYCNDNTVIQAKESESRDELETADINHQTKGIIPLNEDNENESIVISYLRNRDTNLCNKGLSETSLDVHIPSHPGSPRSLRVGSRNSLLSLDDRQLKLKNAVDSLHSDNDFLVTAETGDDKLLEILLSRRPNLQQTDHLGRNALHLAVCSGSEAAMIMLLNAGINPNVKDNVGMTPLSLCLMRSPSIKIVNLLFDHGAVILPRSCPMDTGLFLQFIMMCTPTKEEEKIIRLFVNKGALVNDPEAPGQRQALHFAAMSNNCHLIEVLIDLGADLYAVNHRNETPREVAMTFRFREAFILLEEMEEHGYNYQRS